MKLFITNLCVTIIIYLLVYLIKSFVIWDFTNPFQWIINIPTFDAADRFLILFYTIVWQGFQISFVYKFLKT